MDHEPYTLLDDLPRRILTSFPKCNERLTELNPDLNTDLFLVVVGGFAVQLHLHDKELLRPTNDIDVSPSTVPFHKLSKTDFKEGIFNVLSKDNPQYLMSHNETSKGYEVKVDPSGGSGQVNVIESGKPLFFIHINQFSKRYREKHSEWKAREIENSQEIDLTKFNLPNLKIRTFRIEDIIANKMRRLGYFERNGILTPDERSRFNALSEGNWKQVYSIDFLNELNRISSLSQLADLDSSHFGNEKSDCLDHFKVRKDLYDIAVLLYEVSEGKLEFDEKYFKHAIEGLYFLEKV